MHERDRLMVLASLTKAGAEAKEDDGRKTLRNAPNRPARKNTMRKLRTQCLGRFGMSLTSLPESTTTEGGLPCHQGSTLCGIGTQK